MKNPITELQGTVTSNGCVEDNESQRGLESHLKGGHGGGQERVRKHDYQGGVEVREGQYQ